MRSRSSTARAILLALLVGCGGRSLPVTDVDGSTALADVWTPLDSSRGGAGGAGGAGTGGSAGTIAGKGGAPPVDGGLADGPIAPGCGRCGAEACPIRPGQPRVVVTSPFSQPITALAVSSDTLYFGTYPNQGVGGEIRAVPLVGGTSRLLASDVMVRSLHLEGATLYYAYTPPGALSANLASVPVAGGTSMLLASGNELRYLAFNASGIYFADQGSGQSTGRIMLTDRKGSAPTVSVNLTGVLWGFDIDDANIYWAEYANGGVLRRRSLSGGDTTTLRTTQEGISSPVSDSSDIDYIEGTNTPDTCRSRVMAVAKAGGAPQQISPGSSGVDVWGVVRDDTHIYWASNGSKGAIYRTQKGQTPEILAANQQGPAGLVVGVTDVYWISRSVGSSSDVYEVRAVPK